MTQRAHHSAAFVLVTIFKDAIGFGLIIRVPPRLDCFALGSQ